MAAENTKERRRNVINLFRVAGIQVNIDYSWFIIFVLIFWSLSAGYFPRQYPGQTAQAYWFAGFVATILFFFSVLFHELSHSIMAMRLGINIPEITLFIFGGVSRLSEEPKDPQNELKIAIVGPLSSFVLAGLFWVVRNLVQGMNLPLMVLVFSYLTWINIALGVFNLLPGFPLDGGRVFRAIAWWRTGSLARATKWASDIGKSFAVALMVLGAIQIFAGALIGGLWLVFIGIFLRGIAEGGYQEVMMRQSLEDVKVRDVMIHDVVTVPPDLKINGLIDEYFLRFGYKGFPVVSEGRVSGIVSLAEVKEVPNEQKQSTDVGSVMHAVSDVHTIDPELSLADALKKMGQQEVNRLLVMEHDKLMGMITKTGLLRFLEIRRILEH